MKKLLSLGLLLAVMLSCAPSIPVAEFKDSNQYFIDKTAANLKVKTLLEKTVPAGSKICVVSMEVPSTLDAPIFSTIQDQVITQAVVNGNVVYERDPELLKYLIEEKSNEQYSILSNGLVQKFAVEDSMAVRFFETQLAPSDYLLAYRILECGLKYGKSKKQGFTKREGLIRLHVRMINTATGQILLAGTLSGQYEDEIKTLLVRKLQDFHYDYYAHEMPVQKPKKFIVF